MLAFSDNIPGLAFDVRKGKQYTKDIAIFKDIITDFPKQTAIVSLHCCLSDHFWFWFFKVPKGKQYTEDFVILQDGPW